MLQIIMDLLLSHHLNKNKQENLNNNQQQNLNHNKTSYA